MARVVGYHGGRPVIEPLNPAMVLPPLLALYLHPAPDDTALLRQCLDALVAGDWYIDQLEMIVYSADDKGTHEERAKVQAAIAALRERLGETP